MVQNVHAVRALSCQLICYILDNYNNITYESHSQRQLFVVLVLNIRTPVHSRTSDNDHCVPLRNDRQTEDEGAVSRIVLCGEKNYRALSKIMIHQRTPFNLFSAAAHKANQQRTDSLTDWHRSIDYCGSNNARTQLRRATKTPKTPPRAECHCFGSVLIISLWAVRE